MGDNGGSCSFPVNDPFGYNNVDDMMVLSGESDDKTSSPIITLTPPPAASPLAPFLFSSLLLLQCYSDEDLLLNSSRISVRKKT